MGNSPPSPPSRRSLVTAVLVAAGALLVLLLGFTSAPASAVTTPPGAPAATSPPPSLLPTSAPTASPSAGAPGEATPSASPGATDEPTTTQAVRGTLLNAGEPLEGVVLTAQQNGVEVGRATSSAAGAFRIDLPAPGLTLVTLEEESLPDGVEVRQSTREVPVRPGAIQPAVFLFGEADDAVASRLDRTPQLILNGIQYGLVLGLGALGISLVFGTTGLTNFAHGELLTLGALLGYFFNVTVGMNLIPATCLAVIVSGVLGGVLDKGLWKPLRRRGTGLVAALIVSIGLGLSLKALFLFQFGGGSRSYAQYATQDPWTWWKISILPRDVVIIAICLLALVLVAVALQKTRIGKATRAISDNPALAASSGIDVDSVINKVWVAGTALAALGGVFLALSQQVGFELGSNALLLIFAGVTLGGLGTAYGALLGSLVIGLVTQLSTLFFSAELQVVFALLILILGLVLRPQGLLGRAERVG